MQTREEKIRKVGEGLKVENREKDRGRKRLAGEKSVN